MYYYQYTTVLEKNVVQTLSYFSMLIVKKDVILSI